MTDADILKPYLDGGASTAVPTGYWLSRYRNLERRGLIKISFGEKDDLYGNMWNIVLTESGRALTEQATEAMAPASDGEIDYTKQQYFNIEIRAAKSGTKIWLSDLEGCLVKMSVGKLSIGLMPGDYAVEFGLGTTNYPIHLDNDMKTTQKKLEAGPTCARPVFKLIHQKSN